MVPPMQPALAQVLLAWATLAICTGPGLGAGHCQLGHLDAAAAEFLTAHNQARAAAGVAPLCWAQPVAAVASRIMRYQQNKKGCEMPDDTSMDHMNNKFGYNRAWYGGRAGPRQVVDRWASEKKYYNHAKNSCEPQHQFGLYTQVVWNRSVELGCAQATCASNATVTLCLYSPPGNYVGESPY